MPSPVARRNALFALFAIPGLALSSWVTRTPDVRDLLSASTAEMGFVLFGLSVGSMLGVVSAGRIVARVGNRPVILLGLVSVMVSLPVVALGAGIGSAPTVAAGLFLFGIGTGTGEIATNIEAAEVERVLGRPVLPTMHGCFSLGTVVGAVLGIWLTAVRFPVPVHLLVVFAACAAVFLVAARFVARATPVPATPVTASGPRPASTGAEPVRRFRPWAEPGLLLLGVIVLAMAFAEGSAGDWLPLTMVDGHGFDASWSSVVYALFAAAMTAGRFGGAVFIRRFGRAVVLGASIAAAGVGMALVVFPDAHPVVVTGVVLWGLGTALGFPVAISAAGDVDEHAAQRVSFVATAGYVAFLVGPPVLGVVGDDVGIRYALVVVLALVAVALCCTPSLRERRPDGRRATDADDAVDAAA